MVSHELRTLPHIYNITVLQLIVFVYTIQIHQTYCYHVFLMRSFRLVSMSAIMQLARKFALVYLWARICIACEQDCQSICIVKVD